MRATLLALVFVIVGCGVDPTSSSTSSPGIEGSWIYLPSSTTGVQLVFNRGIFDASTFATLAADNSPVVQLEHGTYKVSGNQVTLTTSSSSCQGVVSVPRTRVDTFSINGETLTLTTTSSVTAFKAGSLAAKTSAKIGCLTSDGKFTAHPVTAVP